VTAGSMTCRIYFRPVNPKLRETSTTFVGMPRIAPTTPKKMAHTIEVKSRIMTEFDPQRAQCRQEAKYQGKVFEYWN
jgi:hypothetical protein